MSEIRGCAEGSDPSVNPGVRGEPERSLASIAHGQEAGVAGTPQSVGGEEAGPMRVWASTCGHMLHSFCLDRYHSSLLLRHFAGATYAGANVVDLERGQFLCPVCRRLANCLLPAVPIRRRSSTDAGTSQSSSAATDRASDAKGVLSVAQDWLEETSQRLAAAPSSTSAPARSFMFGPALPKSERGSVARELAARERSEDGATILENAKKEAALDVLAFQLSTVQGGPYREVLPSGSNAEDTLHQLWNALAGTLTMAELAGRGLSTADPVRLLCLGGGSWEAAVKEAGLHISALPGLITAAIIYRHGGEASKIRAARFRQLCETIYPTGRGCSMAVDTPVSTSVLHRPGGALLATDLPK
ncbi:hypothetical protein CYMTET_28761 [Cymbomonas tetramitiformis]|uniref:E3 ubiquitin-protein ligase n=1 Tax=Cymbomonas tetramitiformis TaxID=36881 RepID=A0AAE0KVM2_9CHLO|nr:hypothetical protein CYMTET_28761 [Cymbomonas tetramitiformis]